MITLIFNLVKESEIRFIIYLVMNVYANFLQMLHGKKHVLHNYMLPKNHNTYITFISLI